MSSSPSYKDNLLEQVGGPSQFDFIIIKYCENIQDDANVSVLFANENLDMYSLIDVQKEFLNAALLDLKEEETEAAMGRLAVKYHSLLQKIGHDDGNFDALKAGFIEALRDCWVEEHLVAIFDQHYETLRPLFQQHNDNTKASVRVISSMSQRSIHRLGGVTGNPRT